MPIICQTIRRERPMKTKSCLPSCPVQFALTLLLLCSVHASMSTASAQGTAFVYQGRLNDGANPANGGYDLRFSLYTSDPGGSQVGPLLTNSAIAVNNGLFTVTLDFGANVFVSADRFLEIS